MSETPIHLTDRALRAQILRDLKVLEFMVRSEVAREGDGHLLESWFVGCRRTIREVQLGIDQLWRPADKREAVDLVFRPKGQG